MAACTGNIETCSCFIVNRGPCQYEGCENPNDPTGINKSTDGIRMHAECWNLYARRWDKTHPEMLAEMQAGMTERQERQVGA